MKLSPAPTAHNPSGLRPVATAGAGVHFATDPIHGMRTRDCLPALTMQNGTGTGSVAFTFSRLARASLGLATQAMERLDEACPGKARQHVTPRNGGNFSRCGMPRQRRGDAWLGKARQGAATTSPGTAIPDIFPSTKKHPHHAGQRSTG